MSTLFHLADSHIKSQNKILLSINELMIPSNKMTVIIGPNGSGKSTLLRALIGQYGAVTYKGASLKQALKLKKIAWVDQEGHYQLPLTVLEFVRLSCPRDNKKVTELLHYFDLWHLRKQRMPRLSGGEKQRANIIRAMLQNAETILLDEPCNHLDIVYQHKLMDYLKNNYSQAILVLHDLNLAARYADEIIIIKSAKIFAQGSNESILQAELLSEIFNCQISEIWIDSVRYFHAGLSKS